jgi:hypothetical protein
MKGWTWEREEGMRLTCILAALVTLGIAASACAEEGEVTLATLVPGNGTVSEPKLREPLLMLSADGKTTFKQHDVLARAFVAGALKGFVYYNSMMRMHKSPGLFCMSPTAGVSIDEIWQLVGEVLSGKHTQDTIVIVGIEQLKKKYPCEPAAAAD